MNNLCIKIDKVILLNIYLFSFTLFVSKGAASVFGGMIILLWLSKFLLKKKSNFEKTKLNNTIIIFVLALAISGIGSFTNDYIDSLGKNISVILLFYSVLSVIKQEEEVKKVLLLTFISMIIANLFGLYQHYVLGVSRVSGFSLIIEFGGLVAIFLTYSLIFLIWGDGNKVNKVFLFFSSYLFLLNIIFNKSRGSWLAFIGGCFTFSWIKNKKIILIIILLMLLLSLVISDEYTNRFISSFNLKDNRSNLARIALWKGAFLMWKDNPINGVGLGNFQQVYEDNYYMPNTGTTVHAHNIFLQFAAETGIIGLIAFSYLLFSILKYLYDIYLKVDTYNVKLFIFSSFITLIVFIIQGLTELNYGTTTSIRFFWFFVAMNVIICNIYPKTSDI